MEFYLIQLVGLLGYSTLIFSYFRKTKSEILFMQIISYIMFVIHYYLLGGITGAMCNIIGLIAFIIIYFYDKKGLKNKKTLIFSILPFMIVIPLITYQDIFSILPIIASISVIRAFLFKSEDIIRGVGIIAAICWLLYAIVYNSYVAIVFEIITLITIVIAFIKKKRS